MPVDQPMDIAVAVWRCNTDPDYLKHLSDAAASASKFYRARALRLIELCEACDHPSDFYQEVEQFRPDAYVVAELVKMAKMARDSERAKAGATARHGENRAMKADVFSWLDANMSSFGSMDKAAEAIANEVAPIAFRTARAWVGEWKKLRSTGTP